MICSLYSSFNAVTRDVVYKSSAYLLIMVAGDGGGGDTRVMRSEKRGLMGISNSGPGEKGSSRRVYLQVYASDFYKLININMNFEGGREYHMRTKMINKDFPKWFTRKTR